MMRLPLAPFAAADIDDARWPELPPDYEDIAADRLDRRDGRSLSTGGDTQILIIVLIYL